MKIYVQANNFLSIFLFPFSYPFIDGLLHSISKLSTIGCQFNLVHESTDFYIKK